MRVTLRDRVRKFLWGDDCRVLRCNFVIRRHPYSKLYGLFAINPDGTTTLSGKPHYKDSNTAIHAAMRRLRALRPYVTTNSLGEVVVLSQKVW